MTIKGLFGKLTTFLKSESTFFKDVSFVFGGKVIVAILALILTPIIARLYLPESYGEFAIYNTIVQNLVVLGTLSLPLAISTVKKDEIPKVFTLALAVILSFTLIFTPLIYVFRHLLDYSLSTSIFSKYWYLIIAGFIISSGIAALAALNIRLKRFKLNTSVSVSEAFSAKLLNVGAGILNFGTIGLLISDVASKLINILILILKFPDRSVFSFTNKTHLKETLITQKEFPLYSMPSTWLATLSNQIIILIVAFLYDKNVLGQLSMAISLLNIPLNMLSNSFQPVITERLVNLRDGEKSHRFYDKMLLIISLISILGFTTIYLLPASFFTSFLGAKWSKIETIVNLFCWYYIILFIDQTFQSGFVVFSRQKSKLFFNIFDVVLLGIMSGFSILYKVSFETLLIFFNIIKSIVSGSRVIYLWKISNYEQGSKRILR